ncbi:MAG: hypothetical protein WCD18_05020, partial [Thermosynechococcaceae cyanobacterium]
LLDVVLFNKIDSNSAEGRLSTISSATDLFLNHPILGVGWGSNRANSFLANLLANTGIFGFGTFIISNSILVFLVLNRVRIFYKISPKNIDKKVENKDFAIYCEIFVLCLVIITFCQLVSQADYSLMDQWLILGLLISTLRLNQDKKKIVESLNI